MIDSWALFVSQVYGWELDVMAPPPDHITLAANGPLQHGNARIQNILPSFLHSGSVME